MIYFSSGDKGGVGKSLLANALIYHSCSKSNNSNNTVIIDSDTRNSDVYRLHEPYFGNKDHLAKIELTHPDGWLDLADKIEELSKAEPNSNFDYIISLPGGIGKTFTSELETFSKLIKKYNQKIILFWSMDPGVDSINLLKLTFLQCHGFIDHIAVIKNNFFGSDDFFYLWNESFLKILLLKIGATEATMPGLHIRLTEFYKKMVFNQQDIINILELNGYKTNRHTNKNSDAYQGEPLPFFNILNDDIKITASVKYKLHQWASCMSEAFQLADNNATNNVMRKHLAGMTFPA